MSRRGITLHWPSNEQEALCKHPSNKGLPWVSDPGISAAYKESMAVMRAVCLACPQNKECLLTILTGPSWVEGFYAGTSARHRRNIKEFYGRTRKEIEPALDAILEGIRTLPTIHSSRYMRRVWRTRVT